MSSIAIIIATYNSAETLERCLVSCDTHNSVDSRVYIVDGGSTDGTIEICQKFQYVTVLCSEEDNGIYDAWNKALKIVEADWYCFIGSDDYFTSNKSLGLLLDNIDIRTNFISGNAILFQGDDPGKNKKIGQSYTLQQLKHKMPAIHTGSLHHKSLFSNGCFDKKYRIAGDYEFLCRNQEILVPKYLNQEIVYMQDGGVSKREILAVITETFKVQRKYFRVKSYIYLKLLLTAYAAKVKNIVFR